MGARLDLSRAPFSLRCVGVSEDIVEGPERALSCVRKEDCPEGLGVVVILLLGNPGVIKPGDVAES